VAARKAKRNPSRAVVESRVHSEGTYQRELVKCGKSKCGKCAHGPSHGPYWYLYQWEPGKGPLRKGGRLRSFYIGKHLVRRRQLELLNADP
jgi:hypothetical protein